MAKKGGFEKRSKASEEIPSSSLADIAFLLLIFFMVSTVFPSDRERPINWPEAGAAQKTDEKKKNILNVWIQKDGNLYINDQQYQMDALQKELVAAGVVRVVFATKLEQRMQRERR